MTDTEFTLTQDRLANIAMIIRTMDLKGFVSRLHASKKIASILDPDIYLDMNDVDAITAIASAAHTFQGQIEATKKNWRERRARRILSED